MRSSKTKTRSSRYASDDQRALFTTAAIQAIAQTAVGNVGRVHGIANAVIHRYIKTSEYLEGAVSFLTDVQRSDREWSDSETDQFFRFANLLELGAQAGYVDLSVWPDLELLTVALDRFHDDVKLEGLEAHLTTELRRRIGHRQYAAASLSGNEYHAFASYLQLLTVSRDDQGFRLFLSQLHVNQQANADLAFLISPRHFAEAVATDRIGDTPFPQVNGGLAAIRYLRWYSDILQRLPGDSSLRDNLIRHTHWLPEMHTIYWRLNRWWERLNEWEEIRYELKVRYEDLQPSQDDLARLGIELNDSSDYWFSTTDWNHLSLDQLLQEGRLPAAKKQQRAHVVALRDELLRAGESDSDTLVDDFVRACHLLMQLGEVDSAAMALAPYLSLLTRHFGSGHPTTKLASQVLLRARDQNESIRTAATVAENSPLEQATEDVVLRSIEIDR